MALSKFVKISKVDNLSDARYCSGMMVDMLGFNLVQDTPRYVDPVVFAEITEWVAGVQFVGEFNDLPGADIKLFSQDYSLDFIETTRIESLEDLSGLDSGIIMRVDRVLNEDQLTNTLHGAGGIADYLIFQQVWDELEDTLSRFRATNESPLFILGDQITTETVKGLDPIWFGVEMEGSMEERPGFSDYGQVMDVLEILEID